MTKFRDKTIFLVIILCFLSASTSAETLRLPLVFVENKEDEQTESKLLGLNIISVDLGGTKIAGGGVKKDGSFYSNPKKKMTPAKKLGKDAVLDAVVDMILETAEAGSIDIERIDAIGVGSPGIMNETGLMVACTNLALEGLNVADELESRIKARTDKNIPVYVLNDMKAAVLGEAEGRNRFTYMTVSTGVNGARFNKENIINLEEATSINWRELEKITNGERIAETAKRKLKNITKHLILDEAGGSIDNITAEHVGIAANKGNELAKEIFAQVGEFLGGIIVKLVDEEYPELEGKSYDKEIFVIGGGVSNVDEPLFSAIREGIRKAAAGKDSSLADKIELVKSTKGSKGAIYGAARFAYEKEDVFAGLERGPLGLELLEDETKFLETRGTLVIDYQYVRSSKKFQKALIHLCRMLKELRGREPNAYKGKIKIVLYDDSSQLDNDLLKLFSDYKDFVDFIDMDGLHVEFNSIRGKPLSIIEFFTKKSDKEQPLLEFNIIYNEGLSKRHYEFKQDEINNYCEVFDILAFFRLYIEWLNSKDINKDAEELYNTFRSRLVIDERKESKIINLIEQAEAQRNIINNI